MTSPRLDTELQNTVEIIGICVDMLTIGALLGSCAVYLKKDSDSPQPLWKAA